MLLVNKSLIMSVVDWWMVDVYKAVINKQVEDMDKAESKLVLECAMYGTCE